MMSRRSLFDVRLVMAVLVVGLVFSVLGYSVYASNGSDLLSEAKDVSILHWFYIAGEDPDSLMMQYTDDAVLYWLGGPLNGVYSGKDDIMGVWITFFNAWEDEYVNVGGLNSYKTGDKYYVVADVNFILRSSASGQWVKLSLTYILVFSDVDGSLMVDEEWWIIRGAMPIEITSMMS